MYFNQKGNRTIKMLKDKIWLAMADACFDSTDMTVLQRFEWAKLHGCLSIEAGEAGINNPQAYIEAMQQTGLFVHGVNVWNEGSSYFDKAIESAKLLGASYITHQAPTQTNREAALSLIKQCQHQCFVNGLDYLLETHRWTISERLDDVRYYLAHNPELNILSDISHYVPLLHKQEAFHFLHPRTKAMHIRVAMPNNVQVEIGEQMEHEGCELFGAIWTDLLRAGFSGPVVGEIIPHYLTYPKYDTVADNVFGLKLFKQTIEKAGFKYKLQLSTDNTELQ
jgi:hypothetical protein